MLSIILLLGLCSPHWTTGKLIVHNSQDIYTTKKDGNEKSLVSVRSLYNPENGNAINVSSLELNTIENGAFSELKGAEKLNLEYNRLKELNLSVFSNLPNLTEISVAHNHITKLNGDVVGSPNLKYLNLSDNNMINLKESNIEGLPESVEIIIGRSRLEQHQWIPNEWDLYGKLMQIHSWYQYLIMGKRHLWETYHDPPIPWGEGDDFIAVELCKTDDGTVEFVKEMAKEELHENCRSLFTNPYLSEVLLHHHGLKKFQRGWFQLLDIFTSIYIIDSNFSKITPELVNDLPSAITQFRLHSTNITTIKKNIIDNQFLKVIDIKSNPLVTIEAGAFEKTNLHSILLMNCSLSSMEFVRTLPTSLKYLNLNNNQFSEIPKNCLSNLKALEVLEIQYNQFTHLSLDRFQGLKELRYLNIASNNLQKIEAGIFDNNRKLAVFDARDNSIKELEDGVFKNLKELRVIILEKNKIKEISSKTFFGLQNGYLYRMNLKSNQINVIERGSFVNMTIDHLDFSDNQLTEKSVEEGAFESCKFGEVSPDLHTIGVEYTSLIKHHHFYGLKVRYETTGIYTAHGKWIEFFISIPD